GGTWWASTGSIRAWWKSAGQPGLRAPDSRAGQSGRAVLEMTQDRLDVAPADAEARGNGAVVGAGTHAGPHMRRERTQAVRQRRSRCVPAMRQPGVAQGRKPRPEPVLAAPLVQQLQEPALERGRNHPGRAVRLVVAGREDRTV